MSGLQVSLTPDLGDIYVTLWILEMMLERVKTVGLTGIDECILQVRRT